MPGQVFVFVCRLCYRGFSDQQNNRLDFEGLKVGLQMEAGCGRSCVTVLRQGLGYVECFDSRCRSCGVRGSRGRRLIAGYASNSSVIMSVSEVTTSIQRETRNGELLEMVNGWCTRAEKEV